MKKSLLFALVIFFYATAVFAEVNDLVFDPYTPAVWAFTAGGNSIMKIDHRNGHEVAEYFGHSNSCSGAMDTYSANHPLWVSNNGDNTISVVNRLDGATIKNCNVGTAPGGIAYDPDDHTMWVANNNSPGSVMELALIENSSDPCTILHTYTSSDYPALIIYDPYNHSMVWGTCYNSASGNTVQAINTSTRNITTYTVGNCPYAVAYDPVTHSVWSANYASSSVSKINTDTSGITTIPTGSFPNQILYDPYIGKMVVSRCEGVGYPSEYIDPTTNVDTATTFISGAMEVLDTLNYNVFGNWASGSSPNYVFPFIVGIPYVAPTPCEMSYTPPGENLHTALAINFNSLSSGSTIIDSSSNAFTITNSGVTGDSSGCSGYAGTFTTTSYASVPYSMNLSPVGTHDWKVKFKLKATSLNATTVIFVQASTSTPFVSIGEGIYIYYTSGTLHIGQISGGDHSTAAINNTTLTNGSCHTFVVSHLSGVNSVTMDTVSQTMTNPNDSTNYAFTTSDVSYIGGDGRGTAGLTGSMDDFELDLTAQPLTFLCTQDGTY